ncbi:hypothetical protein HOU02_gp100 [Caulobacter phage CcrBL9]|uniref:Uncharacterized protein n=1 Tax=Caulobacter phage CcrBL9 TaxID=2283270 RepID=A0A385EB67_9CAUD|nr:hypothetical protein HOU02_gp100 [Caulobacter phage CcrBL9]AXQ69124.1 hypothetical protein CcrBL9_gp100 [Caulobacter phage CcrBL9]
MGGYAPRPAKRARLRPSPPNFKSDYARHREKEERIAAKVGGEQELKRLLREQEEKGPFAVLCQDMHTGRYHFLSAVEHRRQTRAYFQPSIAESLDSLNEIMSKLTPSVASDAPRTATSSLYAEVQALPVGGRMIVGGLKRGPEELGPNVQIVYDAEIDEHIAIKLPPSPYLRVDKPPKQVTQGPTGPLSPGPFEPKIKDGPSSFWFRVVEIAGVLLGTCIGTAIYHAICGPS